jgi:hypothetical protein
MRWIILVVKCIIGLLASLGVLFVVALCFLVGTLLLTGGHDLNTPLYYALVVTSLCIAVVGVVLVWWAMIRWRFP